ncbi:MAG: amino acid ABC transporter permease [Oscillospiraceae bacterium]|jgi:His/Glu/Gln/Arg/opine family amino acid ABC transporter permease subunit|nr:amino acid ABC transporter permease [Oscillospiraceae bacterium]
MPFDVSFVPGYVVRLLQYLPQTLWVVAASLIFGLVLSLPLTYARFYRVKGFGRACEAFVSFIRGTPPVLQLLVVYYALIRALLSLGMKNGEFVCAIVALGLNAGGFFSEAMLSALRSVPVGQTEAAYSVGMTRARLMRRITLPMALPVAAPNMLGICFVILKESALVFYIGVVSVMSGAKLISSSTFRLVEAYVAAAIIYFPICAIAERLSALLQKRLRRYVREAA